MSRKKAFFTVAILCFTLLFAGCDLLLNLFQSVPGDWTLDYSWTGHVSGSTSIIFTASHTFTTGDGGSGTWTKTGSSINFTFSAIPNSVYIGTVSGSSMSGTMTNSTGWSGTWTATKDASLSIESRGTQPAADSNGLIQ